MAETLAVGEGVRRPRRRIIADVMPTMECDSESDAARSLMPCQATGMLRNREENRLNMVARSRSRMCPEVQEAIVRYSDNILYLVCQCGAGGGGGAGFRHINESVLNELEEIPFLADGRRTPSAATKEKEGNAKKEWVWKETNVRLVKQADDKESEKKDEKEDSRRKEEHKQKGGELKDEKNKERDEEQDTNTKKSGKEKHSSRHFNSLTQLLAKHAELGSDVNLQDREACNAALKQVQNAIVEIKTLQTTSGGALYAFTDTVDRISEPLTKEEDDEVSECITNAEELIASTTDMLLKLEMTKASLASHNLTFPTYTGSHPPPEVPAAKIELPRIPIPEFNGKSWQWDSFWELFNATVHSLPLSNLQKFNYLVRTLKGEARESIARFQITSENYPLAVQHLKERYGNVQNIITGLHRQLEHWSARSPQLRDQRKLHDQLSAIIAQLESKGEPPDSPCLLSKILSKFTERIQRSTLKEKVSLPQGETWTLKKLMTTIDIVIKREEEIELHLPKRIERPQLLSKTTKEPESQIKGRSPFCFYCYSKEHWSTRCTKIAAPKARLEYLKKTNCCIGCGSKSYIYADCKSKDCINCRKKHHTSTCFKTAPVKPPQQGPVSNEKKEERKKPSYVRQNLTRCEKQSAHVTEGSIPNLTISIPNLTVMSLEGATSKYTRAHNASDTLRSIWRLRIYGAEGYKRKGFNLYQRKHSAKKEYAEKEQSELLDERRARIEEFLRYNREVPERKIRRLNYMRSEERFLTCSFCLARGEHYSDSCPEYATVDTRSRRARCVLCLDSHHDTEHCWSKGKTCMYCGSTHHNKTFCALPETINKRRKELEKGRHFIGEDDFKTAFQPFFGRKFPDFYKERMYKLPERWQHVVDTDGEYISMMNACRRHGRTVIGAVLLVSLFRSYGAKYGKSPTPNEGEHTHRCDKLVRFRI
ncbi:hypothetical protein RB195_007389 [Necator americanus]|uniref:CCHC-type domain-containing protein n=1 Tax=Necator americanus TaxID=51031 RepID=A0ABR1C0U5_NECAM